MLVSLALPGAAAAQEPGEDWVLDSSTRQWPLEECQRVEVVNRFGGLTVRGYSTPTLEVIEAIQHHADDPRPAQTSVELDDGVVRVEVGYGQAAEVPDRVPETWRKRRVDLTVLVPRTCEVTAETVHGAIRVKGLAAAVSAVSESGDVSVTSEGPVDARTRFGSIRAVLDRTAWEGALTFETVSGEIRVELPYHAELRARLETTGELTSDYSTAVEWAEDGLVKRARVDLGEASRELVLTSQRGAVKLMRNDSSLLAARQAALNTSPRGGETPR